MPLHRAVATSFAALALATLAACGGSSATTEAPPVSGGASAVQGVVTPSSVSVVTAKNAH